MKALNLVAVGQLDALLVELEPAFAQKLLAA
jgi:hypothetical protein